MPWTHSPLTASVKKLTNESHANSRADGDVGQALLDCVVAQAELSHRAGINVGVDEIGLIEVFGESGPDREVLPLELRSGGDGPVLWAVLVEAERAEAGEMQGFELVLREPSDDVFNSLLGIPWMRSTVTEYRSWFCGGLAVGVLPFGRWPARCSCPRLLEQPS